MTTYAPPLADMLFNLRSLMQDAPSGISVNPDEGAEILEEGGRFAVETIAPLNKVGDLEGSRLDGERVVTPSGWRAAYETYAAGGWIAACIPGVDGGMGLPNLVGTCLQEILHSANMAFALCPMLSQSAIKAIALCGSDDQKRRFLPRLTSGEWTGTMMLTEPNAGSDLSAVRTRAERAGEGYRLRGQKIFITYGDHDLTQNIVHLVLARTGPSDSGTKGLSLFIVSKLKINEDGTLGERNDVRCVSLEHKLGIHGSPTAYLSLGDQDNCIGELVGEEGRGLEYMFVMMNEARLSVGIQGLAIGERAYQAAANYASERVQGRIVGDRTNSRWSIRHHPDVHRMLTTMASTCQAMRSLALYAARCIDLAEHAATSEQRAANQARLDFLVPIVKGWCTEKACDISSLALQVYGGMGYVEESGVAQHFRDARITTIYEGTTGIQANDLVGRKVRRDKGAVAMSLLAEIRQFDFGPHARTDTRIATMGKELTNAAISCEKAVEHLLNCDDWTSCAVSVPFLHLFGLTVSAWLLSRGALAAIEESGHQGADLPFLNEKVGSAHFYCTQVLPEVQARLATILDPSNGIAALYPMERTT